MKGFYLGIDVGSVSSNLVIMNEDNELLEALYLKTNGQPVITVKEGLQLLFEKGYRDEQIKGVGVTGSARSLIGLLVGADVVKNEITAHGVAAISKMPDVRTVFEIGGQDSKILIIKNGIVIDFAMNTICAAGTGSFLEQQSNRLKIPIEEFGQYAVNCDESVRIAGRCTVFAESDMIHKQQLGFSKNAIIKGLCEAMVRNYLNNIGKGKKIESPILFQGGVAFNIGIREAFEKELGKELVIPKNFHVMGALGGAILARDFSIQNYIPTKFKGFNIINQDFKLGMITCNDCPNLCEITEAMIDNKSISKWGDRCGKWQN